MSKKNGPDVPVRRKSAKPSAVLNNLMDAIAHKLFVLDTNVLMHDPNSLFNFEEHDVFLPMMTLEELDSRKQGTSEVARNARQASRYLDEIVGRTKDIEKGVPLARHRADTAKGKLFLQTEHLSGNLPSPPPIGKADNQILGVAAALAEKHRGVRKVILVTKDINMRIKAKALGIEAQDYFSDKVLEDSEVLYSGLRELPPNFWTTHGKDVESWKKDGRTFYRVSGPLCKGFHPNECLFLDGNKPLSVLVREVAGSTTVLETLKDYGHHRHGEHGVWGVVPRNREQNAALNLLMDPEVDFVTLAGPAGTGKTLLTLAAGLTQVLEEKRFSDIIITRITIPVGEDVGFLPGTEEEKMHPWMGALHDNLDVLNHVSEDGKDGANKEWGRMATNDLIRSRIQVRALSFMRGRTFLNKFVIIDEAQNLTPKQMKALVTRAGPKTKIVCLGNVAQIDTPYLTAGSSGLAYVVDRFKDWPHGGHITLQRGERSRLADYANEAL